ncbi:MAG: DUF5683 domain-containing protein [Bacteroidales bacterium]
MKEKYHIAILILLLATLSSGQVPAQDSVTIMKRVRKDFKPEPMKATMLSAAFPGLGQIYNHKYWKLPLVYAGFGGIGYAVWYNTKWYNDYIKAYQDFTDQVPETDSYIKLIRNIKPEDYDPVLHPESYNPSTASWISEQMMRQIEYFKKYRDLSYIGIAVWYLVTILDANVDASLFDYDISESLALKIEPFKFPLYNFIGAGVNITLAVNF